MKQLPAELLRIAGVLLGLNNPKKPTPKHQIRFTQEWFEKAAELEPKNKVFVSKTTNRTRKAFEFPTKEELKQYLKEHPKADKSLHWVQKTEQKPKKELTHIKHEPTVSDFEHSVYLVEPKDKDGNKISRKTSNKLYQEIGEWLDKWKNKGVQAADVAYMAIENARKDSTGQGTRLHIVRNKNGRLIGVCSSRVRTIKNKDGIQKNDETKYVHIDDIATEPETYGVGMLLMGNICSNLNGAGLELRATKSAVSYYEHIGMHRDENSKNRTEDTLTELEENLPRFYWSNKEATKFGKQVKAEYNHWQKELSKKQKTEKLTNDMEKFRQSLGDKAKDLTQEQLLVMFKTLQEKGLLK